MKYGRRTSGKRAIQHENLRPITTFSTVMSIFKTGSLILGVTLVGLGGALVATNPTQSAYEDYATRQLTVYLSDQSGELCNNTPDFLNDLLQGGDRCAALIEDLLTDNQDQVRQLISRQTERQNYFFASVYETDLEVHSLLPSYHFKTVGVFNTFFVYEADQQ
jgi:hypothetical protein